MLFLCFEDLDIMWYHHLLTPLEFERVINCLALIVLLSKLDEKSKPEMETKSKCAPDGPVMLAIGFFGVEL